MTQLIDESVWMELNIDTLERRLVAVVLLLKSIVDRKINSPTQPIAIAVDDTAINLQVTLSVNMEKVTAQNGSIEDTIYPLSSQSITLNIAPLEPTETPYQFPEMPSRIDNLEEYLMWLVGLLIQGNEKIIPAQPVLLHYWDYETNSLQYKQVTNVDGSVIMQPERKKTVYANILTQVQFNVVQPASFIIAISLPYNFREFFLNGNLIAGVISQLNIIPEESETSFSYVQPQYFGTITTE